jgi:crotonobetainyl-CoA:carnitine CoA-transferase CaiB-like acyl-CoA transferase
LNGGHGQIIDLSLFEPILRLLEPFVLDFDQLGSAGRRLGNRSDHVAPRNAYRCADGRWVALSASSQSIFERLAQAIDRPDLIEDPRYVTNNRRIQNAEPLDKEISRWFNQHPSTEVMKVMDQAAVAVGLVYDIPMIFSDPHVAHRKSLVQVNDPHFGAMRMCNVVPRLSLTPGAVQSTGPDLGEHTDEVLTELGLNDAEIDRLRQAGAI